VSAIPDFAQLCRVVLDLLQNGLEVLSLSYLECLLDDLVAVHVLHHHDEHLTGLSLALWPAEDAVEHHVAVVRVPLNQTLFDDVAGVFVVGEHQDAVFVGAGLVDDFLVVVTAVQQNVLDDLVALLIFGEL